MDERHLVAQPKLELGGFELGVTPLAQWLVVPPLALYLAAKTQRRVIHPIIDPIPFMSII